MILFACANFLFGKSLGSLENVGKNTSSSDLVSSTSSLDDQRVGVSLGLEGDNVIGALEGGKGMRGIVLLNTNLDLAGALVDGTDESENLLLGESLVSKLSKVGVILGELLEELIGGRGSLEGLGNQGLNREGSGRLHVEARESSQNGDLSGDIQTIEILSGIGLGVSELLGLGDNVGELNVRAREGGELVEDVRQSSRNNTLDGLDLVTGGNEVIEGRDDGQTGTDSSLMVDKSAGLLSAAEDGLPGLKIGGEGLLVGGGNGDTRVDKSRVLVGQGLVGGVVNQNDGQRRLLEEVVDLGERHGSDGGGVELGLPVGQGEGLEVLGDEGLRRSSDENDIVGNGGFDGGKLVDEGLSDKAGSDNSNVNSLGHGGVCN